MRRKVSINYEVLDGRSIRGGEELTRRRLRVRVRVTESPDQFVTGHFLWLRALANAVATVALLNVRQSA